MVINFSNLQNIFNSQINLLLSSTGLTTRCQFNFGVNKKNLCPNCIYDVNLKKSSNKYKPGGPVNFAAGKICPYCNGNGYYGEIHVEDSYLAVIWDYRKWMSPPTDLANPEGYVQTICSKDLLSKIKQCKDMTIVVNPGLANPVFSLYGEPNFAGLGDNNYIFCIWKKTGAQNVVKNILPITPTPTPSITRTQVTPTLTRTLTRTPTLTRTLTRTPTRTKTSTTTTTPTPTPTITKTISSINNIISIEASYFSGSVIAIYKATSTYVLDKTLTISFIDTVGTLDGPPISQPVSIIIPSNSNTGSTQILIDEDYCNLSRTNTLSEFTASTLTPSIYNFIFNVGDSTYNISNNILLNLNTCDICNSNSALVDLNLCDNCNSNIALVDLNLCDNCNSNIALVDLNLCDSCYSNNVILNLINCNNTSTPTPTITPSITRTITPTITKTNSLTPTTTLTPTVTKTITPTITKTQTLTPTITPTNTFTPTLTTTISETPTLTPTITPTISITATRTPTKTLTPTATITASLTPSLSVPDGYAVRSLNASCDPEPSGRVVNWALPIITSGVQGYTIEYLIESCLASTGINSANFNRTANWNSLYSGNLTTVGTNGGPGYYGTYDMNGNVFEWNDLAGTSSIKKGIRGGAWNNTSLMSFFNRAEYSAFITNNSIGLRVATQNNEYNYNNFVYVGNAGNAANRDGYGRVNYTYYIGKYEVTNSEYCEFLNAIAKTDTYRVFPTGIPNSSTDPIRGIARSGIIGNYSYYTKPNMANKPANYINWFSAARYCNWLHNNKPSGIQNNNTTESGAYILNGLNDAVDRSNNAKYYIPTENEWYKAAYYRGGSTSAGYWAFAMQKNNFPVSVCAGISGDGLSCQSYSSATTLGNNITISFPS